MDVGLPGGAEIAAHRSYSPSIESEGFDAYHELSMDHPDLSRPPKSGDKLYTAIYLDDELAIFDRAERDAIRVCTAPLTEPERVAGEWHWSATEICPWSQDLHDFVRIDRPYDTIFSARSSGGAGGCRRSDWVVTVGFRCPECRGFRRSGDSFLTAEHI